MNPLESFFTHIQKSCLPGVWSKAIAMAREEPVVIDSQDDEEIQIRIVIKNRSVHPRITFWPEDDDAHCDCGDRNDICVHIAAAAIALKQGKAKKPDQTSTGKLVYQFSRTPDGQMAFERWIDRGGSTGGTPETRTQLQESLVSYMGGIQSGRIRGSAVSATQDDYTIDAALTGAPPMGVLPPQMWPRLFTLLKSHPGLTYNDQPLQISTEKTGLRAHVTAESGGFRLRGRKDAAITETFKNGVVICDGTKLQLVDEVRLNEAERSALLTAAGRFFSKEEAAELFLDWIPALKKKLPVDIDVAKIPNYQRATQQFLPESLTLAPRVDFATTFASTATAAVATPSTLSFATPDGRTVSAAAIQNALDRGQTWAPLTRDNTSAGFVQLQVTWLDEYRDILQILVDSTPEPIKKLQLARFCEIQNLPAPPDLQELKQRLDDFQNLPQATLPPDLTAPLRHYQQDGVNWLTYLRELGLGALLADDMGLGKTLQALCAIQGRTLIVCPTSVLHSWMGQTAQFRPSLKICRYHGPSRQWDAQADIILTTYGILRSEAATFNTQNWDTLILDEAQVIKNSTSQISQLVRTIPASFKITLSGTPVENSLDDLWSQVDFLMPGYLGSLREFQEKSARNPQLLKSKVKPLILRRLKQNVAPELPPRTETVLFCTLSEEERKTYDALLAASRKEVIQELQSPHGSGKAVFGALELLLRLRQASCHRALLPGLTAGTSSKTQLLLDSLQSALSQNHKALVFSQWTSYLDLIEKEFVQLNIPYLRLDGSTRDRANIVDQFQNPDGPPVLLMSLKAGGVGLTLTAADHVYLMDPWWNPAAEDQAADRAHRIGQTRPVMIHKLAALDTVEEKILALQQHKLQLARSVLEDGTAIPAELTRDDLLALLQ